MDGLGTHPASKALWCVIKSRDIDLSHLRQRTGDAGLDFEEIAQVEVAPGREVGASPRSR